MDVLLRTCQDPREPNSLGHLSAAPCGLLCLSAALHSQQISGSAEKHDYEKELPVLGNGLD